MEGWIKLYRKTLRSPMYRQLNSKQRDVMMTVLLLANHQSNTWEFKGEIYQVKPGQFVTSLENLKENCASDVSIQNIRTALTKLESHGFLTNVSTKRNRLITVVNWAFYQGDDEPANKEINHQLTNNQQTTNRQLTTNKNEKNLKDLNTTTPTQTSAHEDLNPIVVYEQEIGRFTDTIRDKMIDWLDGGYFDEPDAIVIAAIQEAAIYEKRSWAYLDRILQECLVKNIRTVEQFRQKKAEAAALKDKKLIHLPKGERNEKPERDSKDSKYEYKW
ncbi:DnaD domain protein [Aneurinibacillus sp. Ricciae_BoGa-3]|uniref:DnaD domain-containing protein n=1 Tax=Aneurinibacillus sp. Ricciae_BoGa-3 TaxID=3022697 RepID=UPI002340C2F1|nr:DnaD domain protein [Aneurinibacillus sp. Ricciae_BoGa-3]WCK53866.1 DnaD domain protein [Aneurinibacillus sp. Ricciae_BoGa-3]